MATSRVLAYNPRYLRLTIAETEGFAMLHRIVTLMAVLMLVLIAGPAAAQDAAPPPAQSPIQTPAPAPAQSPAQAPAQAPTQQPSPALAPGAAEADLYTVTGIAVDVTADSAAAAREQAFARGERQALARLVERLTGNANALDVSTLSEFDINRLVRSFEVDDERTPPNRYIASLTVSFNSQAVTDLLRQRGVSFTEVVSRPVLVVPVLRTAGGIRLWDSPNPWLEAWLDLPDGERLVPIAVPFGDLQDVADLSDEQAMAGDREALGGLAERYGAGDALVAIATRDDAGLSIRLNRYSAALGDSVSSLEVAGAADDPAVYERAVREVAQQIEQDWLVETRAPSGERNQLLVLVPLSQRSDWFRTRTRLTRVPSVESVNVVSLSTREAVLELDFVGTEDQLRLALAQHDLDLQQGPLALELYPAGRAAQQPGAFGQQPAAPGQQPAVRVVE